jgi:DNA polymerase III delta prime subunit
VNQLISKKAEDGFFKIKVSGANRILINSIRDLRSSIYLKSNKNRQKVILIFDSHFLSFGQGEAANALLKLLEEPPQNTLFILVTDHINLLLNTINSRCQIITFPKLNDRFIEKWLSLNTDLETNVNFFLGLSNGNIHITKKLILHEKNEIIRLINNIIKTLISKNSLLWRSFNQTYSKILKEDKDLFYLHLTILKIWFQSTYRLTKNIRHPLHKTELKIGMERFISNFKKVDYYKIIYDIEDLEKSISLNLFLTLSLTNFILKVQKNLSFK